MHTYMYHVIHATLCFQTHLNIINFIINVKNKKLLRSIIVTAKSSKKIKGDKYMKHFIN